MLNKLKFIKPILAANLFLLFYATVLHAVEVSSVTFSNQAVPGSQSKDASADEQFFYNHIKDLVILKDITLLPSLKLSKVFSYPFYSVNITIDNMTTRSIIIRKNASLVFLPNTSTTQSMPTLLELTKPEFRLKNNTDAEVLQDALDVLYPISNSSFSEKDATAKNFWNNGNQWIFIRGYFFNDLKGFIFTTNQEGVITSISYSLEIKPGTKNQM